MSTYFPSGKDLAGKRKWYVVDAAGQTVGHLASEVASILTGKRNPAWTPFMDMGDHVIVINARKAVLKGSKDGSENVSPAHALPGRHARSFRGRDVCQATRPGDFAGRPGHVAEKQTRARQWRRN